MQERARTALVVWLSVIGLFVLSFPAAAAPPGNWTNYNVDINGDFDAPDVGGVHFEGHGNHPDGWPSVMEFWINLPDGCNYYQQWQEFSDDGDVVTIEVDGDTDCGGSLVGTLMVDYEADRYRVHTNETGGQVKAAGVRDDGADVIVDLTETNGGDDTVISTEQSNVAFYQALTEQFHNTGTPGNPQP